MKKLDRRVLVSHQEGFQLLYRLSVGIYDMITNATTVKPLV